MFYSTNMSINVYAMHTNTVKKNRKNNMHELEREKERGIKLKSESVKKRKNEK